jgi:hypothetical protein
MTTKQQSLQQSQSFARRAVEQRSLRVRPIAREALLVLQELLPADTAFMVLWKMDPPLRHLHGAPLVTSFALCNPGSKSRARSLPGWQRPVAATKRIDSGAVAWQKNEAGSAEMNRAQLRLLLRDRISRAAAVGAALVTAWKNI